MLSVDRIRKTYPGSAVPALDDVSLRLGEGELVALIGHNGAGKSTLFDIVAGLNRPDSGTVQRHVPAGEFGCCPQREVIDWSLTVRQNVELGVALRAGSLRGARRAATGICEVLGLERFLDRQAQTLSGGELRRCQIARAIAGQPRLMLLDEPTTGLDPDAVRQVFEYLAGSARAGGAVLVSTHETSRFAGYCTRVVAIAQGRVLADLPTAEFLSSAPDSDDLWDAYRALAGSVAGLPWAVLWLLAAGAAALAALSSADHLTRER
ncbi:ABC-type multidrug transport system ATPase subunit [Kitasatospora sp. MAA4]|uniref:ABC transporter ATP-binding protein n=1 Tax=Kitasatospora sp. MAA4 TaxID=3035093 RepID=UPI0024763DE3|nr:ABC transporter ATP-binding protein [Kitasatospora sp. MAA4]MDH6133717.1 ABC-type multidrug transport system ATPase subunit [Kitasatospora sp. MAA4]